MTTWKFYEVYYSIKNEKKQQQQNKKQQQTNTKTYKTNIALNNIEIGSCFQSHSYVQNRTES